MGKKKYVKIETPKPLKLVQHMSNCFPRIWEIYDIWANLSDVENKSLIDSIEGASFRRIFYNSIIKDILYKYGYNNIDIHTIYVLGTWRKYKEIYSIDKDLAELLMSNINDINIPVKTLLNIPFPSLYIEVEGTDLYKENGFFVVLDKSNSELEFFTMDYEGNNIAMPLILNDNYTISEAINKVTNNDGNHNESIEFIKKAIQLVLYICAVNADIDENPNQKTITRKSTSNSKPKDVLREIRKWDVGYRVGKTIRASKISEHKCTNISIESYKNNSSPKRPHVRRGHFHNFWVGNKANNTRKLKLKWIAPTFINAKVDDELPAIINKVK